MTAHTLFKPFFARPTCTLSLLPDHVFPPPPPLCHDLPVSSHVFGSFDALLSCDLYVTHFAPVLKQNEKRECDTIRIKV